jgi:hypothetical protein
MNPDNKLSGIDAQKRRDLISFAAHLIWENKKKKKK